MGTKKSARCLEVFLNKQSQLIFLMKQTNGQITKTKSIVMTGLQAKGYIPFP